MSTFILNICNVQICTSVMITYTCQMILSDPHDNINQSSRKERRLKKYPSKEEKKLESLIVKKNYHLAKEKKKMESLIVGGRRETETGFAPIFQPTEANSQN